VARFEVTLVDGRSGSVAADRYAQERDGYVTFYRGNKQVHRIERSQIAKLLANSEPGKRFFMLGTVVLMPLGVIAIVIGLITGFVWGFWPLLWIGGVSLILGIATPLVWGVILQARASTATKRGMAEYFRNHPEVEPGSPESLSHLAQVINAATGITVAQLDKDG
jgi:hypothetical protein